jgi:hypothetical protein
MTLTASWPRTYRFMAEKQVGEIGIEIDIQAEPSPRDSGPAMAAIAAFCRDQRREAGGLPLPSAIW